jgi:pimeloyl-ACP methyl ester carboxylesterase
MLSPILHPNRHDAPGQRERVAAGPDSRFLSGMILRASVLLLLLLAKSAAAVEPRVTEGEIQGAKFALAAAENWNGSVLIYCHGLRAESEPLAAELLPLRSAQRKMLEHGWLIAATSYRRNGLVVADGLRDVIALRDEIARRFGAPRRVLLHGESMGATIATLLMERESEKFSGALAVGAALSLDENGIAVEFTARPGGPILFLSNRNEADRARHYVDKAAGSTMPPVLWTADRDGHVNVNQREVGTALSALNGWLDGGVKPAPQDDTLAPEPRPSTMIAADGDGRAAMTQRNPLYGNITLDFQAADFEKLGIGPGATFTLTFASHSVPVRLGTTYNDVPRGDYVAFFDAEDRLLVAINRGNASEALGVKVGDLVTVGRAAR